MPEKTQFEFQVGDIVHLRDSRMRGVFRVIEQIHWKDDPENFCIHVANLDGSDAGKTVGCGDSIMNEYHFVLDRYLTAVLRVRNGKEENKK